MRTSHIIPTLLAASALGLLYAHDGSDSATGAATRSDQARAESLEVANAVELQALALAPGGVSRATLERKDASPLQGALELTKSIVIDAQAATELVAETPEHPGTPPAGHLLDPLASDEELAEWYAGRGEYEVVRDHHQIGGFYHTLTAYLKANEATEDAQELNAQVDLLGTQVDLELQTATLRAFKHLGTVVNDWQRKRPFVGPLPLAGAEGKEEFKREYGALDAGVLAWKLHRVQRAYSTERTRAFAEIAEVNIGPVAPFG